MLLHLFFIAFFIYYKYNNAMDIKKLNRIKDTSKYYKLLLDYFSTPIDQEYNLTDEQIALFQDKELYDQFVVDLAGRIILDGEEDNKDRYPEKFVFDRIFRIESSNSTDRKEQMKQIRNCFAHSLTEKKDDIIEFDNGKIKGTAGINQLGFSNMLYSYMESIYDVISDFNHDDTSFVEACYQNPRIITLYSQIAQYFTKRILAGAVRSESIKSDKDIEDLLNRGKSVWISGNDISKRAGIAIAFDKLIKQMPYQDMTPTAIKKVADEYIIDSRDIHIKSLYEHKIIMNSYLDYVGRDNFYGLNFQEQKMVIDTLFSIDGGDKAFRSTRLVSSLFKILNLKQSIDNGERKFEINGSDKFQFLIGISKYTNAFDYEAVLNAYMYNRLVYLKELLNTNQIDETILDYSKIDISDIDADVKFTKKEINERRQELDRLIEVCKKRIVEQKQGKEKDEKSRDKYDNPKNPKRDEIVPKMNERINRMQAIIEQDEKLLEQYESERDYISRNKAIPLKPLTLFRVLRNSATHGFQIYSRTNAYSRKNLQNLMVGFKDHSPKTSINMSAERMLKLIEDIENVIIENVDRINDNNRIQSDGGQSSILVSAITATEQSVSENSMITTVQNVANQKINSKEKQNEGKSSK